MPQTYMGKNKGNYSRLLDLIKLLLMTLLWSSQELVLSMIFSLFGNYTLSLTIGFFCFSGEHCSCPANHYTKYLIWIPVHSFNNYLLSAFIYTKLDIRITQWRKKDKVSSVLYLLYLAFFLSVKHLGSLYSLPHILHWHSSTYHNPASTPALWSKCFYTQRPFSCSAEVSSYLTALRLLTLFYH